jgi:hypothetical protein
MPASSSANAADQRAYRAASLLLMKLSIGERHGPDNASTHTQAPSSNQNRRRHNSSGLRFFRHSDGV